MKDINLATADKAALKSYAEKELNLKLTLSMNESTMREKIVAKCAELGIDAPVAEIKEKGEDAKGKKVKKITIYIPNQDRPGGDEPVFVGVQGVGYLIPRAINVNVPPSVVEVLKNGMTDHITQDPESGEMQHNEVLTYPYQIIGEAA